MSPKITIADHEVFKKYIHAPTEIEILWGKLDPIDRAVAEPNPSEITELLSELKNIEPPKPR